VLVVAIVLVLALLGLSGAVREDRRVPSPLPPLPTLKGGHPSEERARSLLGTPASGQQWFSGAWAGGGTASTARVKGFGAWRGAPVDAVTMYPEVDNWQSIYESTWHITTFDGLAGPLVYGLPMLPRDADGGDLLSIASGEHDWVYRKVAQDLVANGRGTSIIRIGWEPNGDWFPWNARASDAEQYIAAYRHIVGVLRTVAPNLVIDFDVACGTPLRGQVDRLDALNLLYPGDDAVDLVGCDFYDWYTTKSQDESGWRQAIRPPDAVGIADVANFARAHGKGLTYPEWGLASTEAHGVGDNPFFVEKMRSFFEANADVLVLESYFSEPEPTLSNSLWDPVQMPASAKVYADRW